MKKLLLFSILTSIFLISCKKNKEITYSEQSSYKDNILAIEHDLILGQNYSFQAKLAKKANLKVVLTNLSQVQDSTGKSGIWFFSAFDTKGWEVSDYSNNSQTFTSTQTGELFLEIVFDFEPGSCRIDYYENSNKITKTKILNWN